MKKIAFYFSLCLVLGACSTMADRQSVLMTVKTPGAENAKCLVENQDHKYVVYTNETIEVMKSPHDLVVRCMAPGNRGKTVLVKREINGWVFVNVANGFVPGAAYDYFSRGGFDYPDVVTVSFVGEAVKPYALPAYEANDLRSENHKGRIEYQGPGTVITEENKYDSPKELKKKSDIYNNFSSFDPFEPSPASTHYPTALPTVSYDPTEEDK